jgi:hypothetical protein
MESGQAGLRVRLWRLHDQIVDGITQGQYAQERQAVQLLMCVRVTLMNAKDFTFLNVIVGGFLRSRLARRRGVSIGGASGPARVLSAQLTDELAVRQREELLGALSYAVLRTSLLGRAGMFVLPALFVAVHLLRRQPVAEVPDASELAERPVRIELNAEMAMFKAAGGSLGTSSRASLAHAAC